jgi:hypothetical protein
VPGHAAADRLDGLGHGVEAERHLGFLLGEQALQDPQLDAGLRRREADRKGVEVLLQAPVDVAFVRHGHLPEEGRVPASSTIPGRDRSTDVVWSRP